MRNKCLNQNSRIFSLTLISICLFSSVLFGQTQISKTNQELISWQQRVDELTDGILKDSKSVDDSDKALYLALLAKIWWKPDSVGAEKYLRKAAETMLSDLESEDKADLAQKLKNSQKTIQIIASLDEQLSQLLAERIAKILEAKGGNDKSNADSFVMIALQIVGKNPQLAFELGVKSLKYGNSLSLPRLISDLNLKDSKLAEQLFQFSLAAARRNYTYEFTGTLGNHVFAERQGKAFSDTSRRAYLEMLADMISNGVLVESERVTRCGVVQLATPILDKFDEYLPGRSQTVRQQIQICLPFSHPFTAEITSAEARGDAPQSVDELIAAARNTKDRGLKTNYFSKAISKLGQMKKFDEIISLLDGMTDEEIKAVGDVSWESWRVENAAASALVYFENKDLPAVYRIVNKTPKKIRPNVRFRIVNKVSPVKDREFYLENLEEIRKDLGSLEILAKYNASNYLTLARLYLKIQPTESEGMFREAVKYINKTDNDNPDFLPEKDYAPLMDFVRLPFELLEVDETSINSSLTNIGSRRSRIRLKLGLLESSLQKFADLKKKAELEKKEQKK